MADDDLAGLTIDKSAQPFQAGKRRPWLRWLLPIFLVAGAALLYGTGIFTPAVTVEVAVVSPVYPSQSFTVLNGSGYVVAQKKASVASKITGRLVAISVEEGSTVKKGDIIARLESEDAAALKDQAAANLDMASSTLKQASAELNEASLSFGRSRNLLAQGLMTQAEFEAAEARYQKAEAAVTGAEDGIRAAQAALRAATVSLQYATIQAPFDAVVLTKNADVGDIITPLGAAANAKASVVTIADMNSLLVEVDVSESSLHEVKMGQPCEIQLDALPDTRFQGAVHMIVPTADRTKATVLIKIRFLNRDRRILPEMSARVAFLQRPVQPGEQQPRLAVNRTSLVTRNGRQVVLRVQGSRAAATPVKTGAQFGEMTEVLGGLKAGDRIIAKPTAAIKDGAKISIAEP